MASRTQERIDIECPTCHAILPTRQGWIIHRRRKHGWQPTEKQCTRCGEVKPVEAFGIVGKHNTRPRSECRVCRSRPSTQTESQWRGERKRYVGRKYGLTPDEFAHVIDYLMRKQNGRCAICKNEELMVLDHCHSTGRLRALLCRTCNSGLGMFRDNPALLRSAAEYLGDQLCGS